MPSNFRSPECDQGWALCPIECLPQEECTGGLSFTIRSTNGNKAVCEVNLKNKAFFYRKVAGGEPYTAGPRTLKWNHFETPELAWEKAKADLNWDAPPCDEP